MKKHLDVWKNQGLATNIEVQFLDEDCQVGRFTFARLKRLQPPMSDDMLKCLNTHVANLFLDHYI